MIIQKIKKKFLRQYHKLFPVKLDKFWDKIKHLPSIDQDLKFITDTFIPSKSYSLISRYWHILGIRNYKSLVHDGFKKYGSSIARNYYGFYDLFDDWVEGAMNKVQNDNLIKGDIELFKKQNNFTFRESIFYNYLCVLLYYNLKKTDSFNFLPQLQDKTYIGFDDPYIKINDVNITLDKLVSLFDYDKIKSNFEIKKSNKILEIGAGAGRVSEVLMTLHKDINYVVCDIPPALYISYKRLKLAFPEKKIKLIIDIDDPIMLEKEINSNDISFIFPHQLEKIKKKFFNLTLALDCLHEMDKKTISYYFDIINNITENFYFTIWASTYLPYSKKILKKLVRLSYESGDYNIPKNWSLISKEKVIFPSNFLSLAYKITD
jgi:putative sugar O-methyltransferase